MIDWLPTDILRRPNVMPEFFTLSDLPVENLDVGDFSTVVLKLAWSMKSVPDKVCQSLIAKRGAGEKE